MFKNRPLHKRIIKGQSLVEYTLLMALILLILIAATALLGEKSSNAFSDLISSMVDAGIN